MGGGQVFQINGADPLAAGFDQVLGAVDDVQYAVRRQLRHVAGGEPAVLVERLGARLVVVEVGADHRGALHQQFAHGFTVLGHFVAVVVDQLHAYAEQLPALGGFQFNALFQGQVRLAFGERAHGAGGVHFGHAPALHHVHLIVLFKGAHHAARRRRAADRHALERAGFTPVALDLGEQAEPYGGYAPGGVHVLFVHQPEQAVAVQGRARHDQRRPGQRRHVGQPPGVDVEHRHHRQHPVAHREGAAGADHGEHRLQQAGAVRIERALGGAGGTGGIAQRAGGVFVQLRPVVVVRLIFQQCLVAEQVLAVGHMRAVGHRHIAGVFRELVAQAGHQRREGGVEEQQAVVRVVDDIGHLLRRQARVDGMADRADTGDGVIKFQVAVAVPGQGGDPVAGFDAQRYQAVSQTRHPLQGLRVALAVQAALHGDRYDFRLAVNAGAVIQYVDQRQGRIHHQPFKHLEFSRAR